MSAEYNLLFSIIVYTFTVLIYTKGIKRSLLDGYRQDLFALRDELFALYFIDENRTITEKDYRFLERLLNANIRFAHRMNLLSLIYLNKKVSIKDSSYSLQINKIKNTEYEVINQKLDLLAQKYILISSPFLSLALIIFGFIRNHFKKFDYTNITTKYYNPKLSLELQSV